MFGTTIIDNQIKFKKTPINKTAFKTFSPNFRKYLGVTTIPKYNCFTGWKEIHQKALSRICDVLPQITIYKASRGLKMGMASSNETKVRIWLFVQEWE